MGFYIDPTDCSKEQWLSDNGVSCSMANAGSADFDKVFPVVLINNGMFTAAGIAYCKEEFQHFAADDPRPRKYFLVDREKLVPFCGRLASN